MSNGEKRIVVSGRTARFSGHGRTLGYPTANVRTTNKLKDGLYVARASLAQFEDHPALVFVGIPTTVGDTDWRVDAHLLDIPDQDYYDMPLRIELVHYLRANRTFATTDDLKRQMKRDEVKARHWFAHESKHV